uniref:S1 motif domain-containing protein n=1 Tax=Pyramimonas obovata TaxID=1411642 RepID=A0A6T7W3C5_9CHLO|mmetsp:Transcript_26405/g.57345  ORF Transcript_26405/g.57345 Transcript_26405/m.57345 type:complete len:192 (+) Transcript_26405:112-687(+)
MTDSLVCPGDKLSQAVGHTAGKGTYVKGQHICAAILGKKQLKPPAQDIADQSVTVEVVRGGEQTSVPKEGDIVTAKVTKINTRMAVVDILCIGQKALEDSFNGIIRQQDVRVTEIDKVQIMQSFRPGDIVRAQVLSLGDARSYYLTTAQTHLGVVYAKSIAGNPMVPISWQEMQCPSTLAKEFRKVAKVAT